MRKINKLKSEEKEQLLCDLQELTAQCMLDFEPDTTHIDNEYVAGFIENSCDSIFEDMCERIELEFNEDEINEILIKFVLQSEKFNIAVKDLDYSSEISN